VTKGYIYILINTSISGLLKIGKSKRSPEIRANELSLATGVPNSFHVAYYLIVSDIDRGELEIHNSLKEYREASNREFFRLPLNQAIDLVRKILQKSNIDFANHEEDSYKFKYDEYTSPKDLFLDILNNEDKWEHAKLHLEKGYLVPWLKKKGEIDALINLDLRSKEKEFDDLDYQLSLISYSILDISFTFRSKSNNPFDWKGLFEHPIIFQSFIQNNLIKNDKLYYCYKGYRDSKGLTFDFNLKAINLIKNNKRKSKNKFSFVCEVLEWGNNPDDFLKIGSLNPETITYLFKKSDYNEKIKQLIIPETFCFKESKSPDLETTKLFVEFIKKYSDTIAKFGYDETNSQTFDKFLLEKNYIPHSFYLKELKKLPPNEFLIVIDSIKSFHVIEELRVRFNFFESLFLVLTTENQFPAFAIGSIVLNFLLEGFSEIDWYSKENRDFRIYSYLNTNVPVLYDNFLKSSSAFVINSSGNSKRERPKWFLLKNIRSVEFKEAYESKKYGLFEAIQEF
jgi:hypothetical protein